MHLKDELVDVLAKRVRAHCLVKEHPLFLLHVQNEQIDALVDFDSPKVPERAREFVIRFADSKWRSIEPLRPVWSNNAQNR